MYLRVGQRDVEKRRFTGDLICKFSPGVGQLTSQFVKSLPILHLTPTGGVGTYYDRCIIFSLHEDGEKKHYINGVLACHYCPPG